MTDNSRPQVRGDLQALSGYHSPQVDVAIRLNTNESPSAPPERFMQDMAAMAASVAWHRYPDRDATELRAAIAALHSGMTAGNVFAANGSNEVLQTLMLTFGGPDRTVVTFEPTYALHRHIAHIVGTPVVSGERGANFVLDADHAVDVIRRERPIMTFLCSPNNPTGLVEDRAVVTAVLDAVRGVGGLLVVDEAYAEFAPWSAIELVSEDSPVVVTRTFSKTWAMAAARLGYLIGPAWLVDKLQAVVLPYHLDAFKQAAGTLALSFHAEMETRVARIVAERERLTSDLENLDLQVWRSGSNFILFRPPGAASQGDRVWQQLLDRGVLVRNCASWERLEGTLRVTVGTEHENRAFIAALTEILETT